MLTGAGERMMDAHTAGVLIANGLIFGVIHVLTGEEFPSSNP